MSTEVTRRAFFGTVAAAATLSSLDPAGAASLPATRTGATLKLGVASYSLRKFTLDQTLAMAKELGVKYMTFKDVHIPRTDPPETTRALRAKIEAAGITIMGGGTINMPNNPDQIRKDFVYARHAGMPLIYASPDPAALDFIETMVKEHDVRLVIHNHGPDVKDLKVKTDRDSQVEVGRGVLDFPGLFRTLLKIGYTGQVGLEYEIKADNPLPGMQESLAYMRGVLAAITT
jgi:sugar phosphate isomerase/epimerase